MPVSRLLKPALIAIGALAFLSACNENGQNAAKGPPAMPPTPVSVTSVQPEDLPITNELPGRIAPTRIAEVRPRVSGIVIERVFEQGSFVKEGDVLYRIDPAPFKVEVDRAKATLARAEAAQMQARQLADRQQELRDRNISSAQQLESAIASLAQSDADVASARAGVAAAELNLHYADVRAPISGRIGRALITEGALVGANSAAALATIQQLDPVYADFTQSSNAMMELRRKLKLGALSSADPGEARVHLLFDDGTPYDHSGRLLFSEAAVDAMTGQVTLRGEFPNPDGDLLPGMYVRVLIEQGIQPNAIAVPQQAVQRDAGGNAQVYVVKPDKTVELRGVSVGRVLNNRWVVDKGLNAGDQIVVEGFQKLRPGATVAPQTWKKAGAQDATAASANTAPGKKPADTN